MLTRLLHILGGMIAGALVGALGGSLLAYGALALIHWLTYQSWQEFWGIFVAPVYGGVPGAVLGAALGAGLAWRARSDGRD